MDSPPQNRLLRRNRPRALLPVGLVLVLVLGVRGRSLLATFLHNITGLYCAAQAAQVSYETGDTPWGSLLADDGVLPQIATGERTFATTDRLANVATALDQDGARWYYVLGHCRLVQRDLEAARGAFTSYLDKGGDRTSLAHFFLGVVRELADQRDQAIMAWRQAPSTARFFLSVGAGELYARDNAGDALEYFEIATEIAPTLCEPHYRLGATWLELGDPQQALLAFSSTEGLDCPDHLFLGESYYQRGKLLAEMGPSEDAIEVARRSLELDRRDVKRLLLLGNLLEKEGSYTEAYSLFAEAIAAAPEKMWPYINLCNIQRLQQDYPDALHWCTLAMERFPESVYAYHYTGLVYLDMEDFREAAAWFEQAAAHETSNANIWIRLGEAYVGAGEPDQALAAYRMALRLDPDNALVQRAIDRLSAR